MKTRYGRVIRKMVDKGINQIIITSPADVYYMTGHWIEPGERLLALYINTDGIKKLIVNEISANIDVKDDTKLVAYNDNSNPVGILAEIIDKKGTMGIDKNWPSHFLIELMGMCPQNKFVNSSSIIDSVRMIKDEREIILLRNASSIVDNVMEELVTYLENGVSEREAAKELSEMFAGYGTYEYSFSPIIAYGANGADPHHLISDVLPSSGDSIVIDIGGRTDHYCSDITRTVFFGAPCDELRRIYEVVLEANMKAIDIVKPGVTFSEIDRTARRIIEEAGYGKYFTHRTGHCIGIEDHEYPSVSSNNDMPVEAGMAFSIEPGIYIPGKYGVRIEDILIVTPDGREVLNRAPKELRII